MAGGTGEREGAMKPKLTVRLEEPNGELASLGMYVRALVKTQDMEAWKNHPVPDAFQIWLRGCMVDYVRNLEVRINP